MGCRAKEFKWVEQFITSKAAFVHNAKNDNVKSFSFAILAFSKGEFEKAIDITRDVEFNNVYDKLMIKNLIVQCYYELAEYSLLDYYTNAYKKFLHTNTLIGEIRKKRVLNFITFTQNLAKNKATGKPSKEELVIQLAKLKPVANFSWLEEKVKVS